VSQPGDAIVIETPDQARAEAIRRDPFSAEWLQDSELTSPPEPEPEPERTDQAETGAAEGWFTPRETVDREPSPASVDNWFTPRERADSELTAPEREPAPADPESGDPELVTGFWTPSAAAAAPAEGHTIPRASWPSGAEAPASDTPEAAERTTRILAQAAAAAASRTIAESAVPPGPVVPSCESRSDRLYPVRLLIVIVVAALIGSILVLLLR
jgi:hypothetical protein